MLKQMQATATYLNGILNQGFHTRQFYQLKERVSLRKGKCRAVILYILPFD